MGTAYREPQKEISRQKMKMAIHPSGIRGDTYDLVSTLYHSIEAVEIYGKYAEDAEQKGENELSTFFKEIQEQERRRVSRAKVLLEERLSQERSLLE